MTPTRVDPELRAALREVASTPRLLVGVDFDGTLAPIVGHPPDARALPESMAALRALASLRATTVVVVSGRSLHDLAALSGVPIGSGSPGEIRLVGSHGCEFDVNGDLGLDTGSAGRLIEVVAAVRAVTDGVPGVLLEPKPTGVAVHVRQADRADAADVVAAIRRGPGALPGVYVLGGKEVIELSVVETDKGRALDVLRRDTDASATVFVGDDVTDETVFARLRRGDVGIKVGWDETAARHRAGDPRDVSVLLALLAESRAALGRAH